MYTLASNLACLEEIIEALIHEGHALVDAGNLTFADSYFVTVDGYSELQNSLKADPAITTEIGSILSDVLCMLSGPRESLDLRVIISSLGSIYNEISLQQIAQQI